MRHRLGRISLALSLLVASMVVAGSPTTQASWNAAEAGGAPLTATTLPAITPTFVMAPTSAGISWAASTWPGPTYALSRSATSTGTSPVTDRGNLTATTTSTTSLYAVGADHSWGLNMDGEVGGGTSDGVRQRPKAVSTTGVLAGTTVTAVSVGTDHAASSRAVPRTAGATSPTGWPATAPRPARPTSPSPPRRAVPSRA